MSIPSASESKKKTKLGRLPPHSIEAEMGVLGCQLLDPQQCVAEVIMQTKSQFEIYYDLRHQTIQEALFELTEQRKPIDLISVQQHLKDKKVLEQVGGIAYLSQLQDAVPSAANLAYYLDIVIEKQTLRKLITTCSNVVGKVFDYEGDVETLLTEVEREILAIRHTRADGEQTTQGVVGEALQMIEEVFNSDGSITGMSTGLHDLDVVTDGLHKGETVVIAAYPSCGKSALALNIAVHNALRGFKVVFYSLEMKPVRLMVRAICAEARVNFYDIRDKKVGPKEMEKMARSAMQIAGSNIQVKDAAGMTIAQIQADARREKQKRGLDLAVIDYLQLATNPDSDSREQEVSAVSKGAKAMAMEHDIPVIILSQLNDDGKMRESRAIGQDAGGIWKIEVDGQKQKFVQPVNLLIEKGRDSVSGGIVKLTFLKTITKFECQSRSGETERAESNLNDEI